jgi:hypothetical protein
VLSLAYSMIFLTAIWSSFATFSVSIISIGSDVSHMCQLIQEH